MANHDNSGVKRHGSMDIEENLKAQRRLWRVQKYGRTFFALLLLIALAGLLGEGPLSHKSLEKPGATAAYERIAYRLTENAIRLNLDSTVVKDGKARILIAQSALEHMRIKEITPEPSSTELGADKTILEFEVAEQRGALPILIAFESVEAGLKTAQISIENGPDFEVRQLFLP